MATNSKMPGLQENYLLLTISENKVIPYIGNNHILYKTKISGMPKSAKAVQSRIPSHKSGYPGGAPGKSNIEPGLVHEKTMRKYLVNIDQALGNELKKRLFPVIIASVKKTNDLFNSITKNKNQIIGYSHGNYEHATGDQLHEAIAPVIEKQEQKRQTDALKIIEKESRRGRLVLGVDDIYNAANEKRGHLLFVEKDFLASPLTTENPAAFPSKGIITEKRTIEPIAETIMLVLKFGGHVVFLDNGKLKEYGGVALVTHY